MKEEKPAWWDWLVFLVLMLGFPWFGFVFAKLWAWFMVPLGLTRIGILHAIGLMIVAKTLHGHPVKNKNDGWTEVERGMYSMTSAMIGPLLSLAFGWIVHHLMM